jgi:hypothetical protein
MKQEKNNKGILVLVICGIIAMALIIGCVFFSDEIFGIFLK